MTTHSLICRIDQAIAEAFRRSPKSPLRLCLKAEVTRQIEDDKHYGEELRVLSISAMHGSAPRFYRGIKVSEHTANKLVYQDSETGAEHSIRV